MQHTFYKQLYGIGVGAKDESIEESLVAGAIRNDFGRKVPVVGRRDKIEPIEFPFLAN